ncbi:MAG: right-handed parallel beta-helix repeat-containing protein [Rubrobacter sp.]|nr:right-handed parallel beta-helix repeat-containing protein [Rubrobacter sp.]
MLFAAAGISLVLLLAIAASLTGGLGPYLPAAESPAPEEGRDPAPDCDRWASPSGDDTGSGRSETGAYRTVQKLVDSLPEGGTGCLEAGTYHGSDNYGTELVLDRRRASEGERITITSTPGERATIEARIIVRAGADFVTFRDLDLVGAPLFRDDGGEPITVDGRERNTLPSPTVLADDTRWTGLDVTNNRQGESCFNLGLGEEYAERTNISDSGIHDCGGFDINHDHGIYVSKANGTEILNNRIYDNVDRGIQLYPDANDTLVRGNVIDGNGQGIIFSGRGTKVSRDNVVENNLLTNSTRRSSGGTTYRGYNVDYHWEDLGPYGSPAIPPPEVPLSATGNVVRDNCISGGSEDEDPGAESGPGGIRPDPTGYVLESNVYQDPAYVDREGRDLRLQPGSPCAGLLSGAEGR